MSTWNEDRDEAYDALQTIAKIIDPEFKEHISCKKDVDRVIKLVSSFNEVLGDIISPSELRMIKNLTRNYFRSE